MPLCAASIDDGDMLSIQRRGHMIQEVRPRHRVRGHEKALQLPTAAEQVVQAHAECAAA